MSEFAQVIAGVVMQIIVADPAFVESGKVGNPSQWVYVQGKTRKNPPRVGGTYDRIRDQFVDPKPYPSWKLNTTTLQYEAPVARKDGEAVWNEKDQKWEPAPSGMK